MSFVVVSLLSGLFGQDIRNVAGLKAMCAIRYFLGWEARAVIDRVSMETDR